MKYELFGQPFEAGPIPGNGPWAIYVVWQGNTKTEWQTDADGDVCLYGSEALAERPATALTVSTPGVVFMARQYFTVIE